MRCAALALALGVACATLSAFAQTRVLTVPGLVPLEAEAQTENNLVAREEHEPARAQAPSPDQADEAPAMDNEPQASLGRFHFQRVKDGLLRLDRAAGKVALCRPNGAGWVCEAVPEDRATLEKEIEQLRHEVAALKQEITSLHTPPPPPRPPQTAAPGPQRDKSADGQIKLPTTEDIARARAFLAETWHRLVEMIETWQKDVLRKT
jgi:hypothetical protein